jgi:serine/threonine protein phosphatase 1
MPDEQKLSPGGATYAIGDLHGEVSLLRRLLHTIPYQPEDTLVFLGDYLDRGENSIETIRVLQALHKEHAKCIFIRGNHDDTWLDEWDGTRFKQAPGMPGARKVWNSCHGHVPHDIGTWLETTRIDYEDDHAYYVHAGIKPGLPFWRTETIYKLWGEESFLHSDYNWGKPVVFGHWQFPQPMITDNKIGVDTGAWDSGILTAVRLPDRQIFQAKR